MKTIQASILLLAAIVLPAIAPAQEIPMQRIDSPTPQIDLRVYVDISVEFWIQGDRIRYNAGGTRDPRNDGSAYSAALPRYQVSNLRVEKEDGRGDIIVLEQPSGRNAWTLKLRISDPKGGEDRYHVRITWDDGVSSPTAPSIPSGRYVEITEMSATAAGSGQLRVGGQSYRLGETSVSLTPSGRAILSFKGDSAPSFRGTWRQNGTRIDLSLDDALGTGQGTATGAIQLSGDRLRTIDIQGSAPQQGAFDLSFDQRGAYKDFTKPAVSSAPQAPTAPVKSNPGGIPIKSGKNTNQDIVSPTPPGLSRSRRPGVADNSGTSGAIDSLSQRVRGDGYLESSAGGDEDDTLKEALVRLDRGGRARFELDGDNYWSFVGTWKQLGDDRIEIQLEQFNSAPAIGRGTVVLRPGRRGGSPTVRQLEMTITASRIGALEVRFRPGD